VSALAFELPPRLEAHEPPEARGIDRDGVALMVATRHDGRLVHARFRDLPRFLEPGDVVVINTSATLPAALSAWRSDGAELELRLSTPAPHRPVTEWMVELRTVGGEAPFGDLLVGERLQLPGRASAEILAPYARGARLWLAGLEVGDSLLAYLERHGRPIRYAYVPREWPLAAYQNVYASEPGSAELPSAGRPFSAELIMELAAAGILVAPVMLHTGVSSPGRGEAPYPERYDVPAATARIVNAVHGWGGRVVAVGTTVVRALETATAPDGNVSPGRGWTSLVIGRERGLWTVDGLLTGWHEPHASHLELLEAAAGERLLAKSYRAALDRGYLWHEFGDSHLILP
jgi:S-adenosylmethionine:tRNA ribosyltransferase-isomerase